MLLLLLLDLHQTRIRKYLESPSLLVQLVNGSSSFSKLIQKILDLITQVLVLPPDRVQLLYRLVPSCSQPEQVGALLSTIALRWIQFRREVFALQTPFLNNLCKRKYSHNPITGCLINGNARLTDFYLSDYQMVRPIMLSEYQTLSPVFGAGHCGPVV